MRRLAYADEQTFAVAACAERSEKGKDSDEGSGDDESRGQRIEHGSDVELRLASTARCRIGTG